MNIPPRQLVFAFSIAAAFALPSASAENVRFASSDSLSSAFLPASHYDFKNVQKTANDAAVLKRDGENFIGLDQQVEAHVAPQPTSCHVKCPAR